MDEDMDEGGEEEEEEPEVQYDSSHEEL